MKRPLFIILGIVLVFILLLVWIYILFFNTNETVDDNFADFDFGDTTDTSYEPGTNNEQFNSNSTVDTSSSQSLRQLTIKPVVGFQEIEVEGSEENKVYYIEAGTGHLFSIDLVSGQEKRLSGTTIPVAKLGVITTDGRFAAVQSGYGSRSELLVGEISTTTDEMSVGLIDEGVSELSITSDNKFLYLATTFSSVVAKQYDPINKTTKVLFTAPFNEVSMDWGSTSVDPHFLYPKSANSLEGYLYKMSNGALSRLPIAGYGLNAISNGSQVLFSLHEDGDYQTKFYSPSISNPINIIFDIIADKCVVVPSKESFLCASSRVEFNSLSPDNWYRGEVSHTDSLLEINADLAQTTLLFDSQKETGRALDIINLQTNSLGDTVYFQNKNDQTLWLYEMTPPKTTNQEKDEDEPISI